MNIDKIIPVEDLNISRQETAKSARTDQNTPQNVEPTATDKAADTADTSQLSSLMAKISEELADDSAVRQDKIDAMREFVNGNDEISDNQIDVIIDGCLKN